MITPALRRRVIQLGGLMILAGSLAYLVQVVMRSAPVWDRLSDTTMIIPVILSCLTYLLLLVLAAVGWGTLVLSRLPRGHLRVILSIYGLSHLAKYLPGNILHLAGRQVLAAAQGFSQRAVAVASVQEAVSVAALCAVLALGGDLLADRSILPYASPALLIGALVVVGMVVALIMPRLFAAWEIPLHFSAVAAAAACHAVFLAGSAAVAYILAARLGLMSLSFGTMLAVWCWAYLVGYATPAAPGGLGVREAVFTALLPQDGDAGPALALALTMRMISVGGDLLFAILGAALGRGGRG